MLCHLVGRVAYLRVTAAAAWDVSMGTFASHTRAEETGVVFAVEWERETSFQAPGAVSAFAHGKSASERLWLVVRPLKMTS